MVTYTLGKRKIMRQQLILTMFLAALIGCSREAPAPTTDAPEASEPTSALLSSLESLAKEIYAKQKLLQPFHGQPREIDLTNMGVEEMTRMNEVLLEHDATLDQQIEMRKAIISKAEREEASKRNSALAFTIDP